MLVTGGTPVTVDEERLMEANDLARDTTGIDADHTGSSGLAGLMELLRDGSLGAGESVAVFLTGVTRA